MPATAAEMRTNGGRMPSEIVLIKSRPAAFRTRAGPKSLNQSRSECLAFDLRNLVGSFLLGRRRLLRPAPEYVLHADVLGARVQPGFPAFGLMRRFVVSALCHGRSQFGRLLVGRHLGAFDD